MQQNNTLKQNKSQRIEYIDALRGFAMLLVVFCHINYFTFGVNGSSSLMVTTFSSFMLPLFFILSGFLAYKSELLLCNGKTLLVNVFKKFTVLVIPALVIGLIYTYFHSSRGADVFINNEMKMGYWFTFSLFQMFLIFYLISYVTRKSSIKGNTKFCFVSLIIVAIFMYIALSPIRRSQTMSRLADIICFAQTCEYFIFFVVGIIASKCRDTFFRILDNRYISAIGIILFFLLLYYKYSLAGCYDSYIVEKFFTRVVPMLLGLLGAFISFNYFRIYENNFTRSTKLGSLLQFIGKRTLDVYWLHYFFIPRIPSVGDFIIENQSLIVEVSFVLVVAMIVVAFALLLSSILRTSKFLGLILFGVKR